VVQLVLLFGPTEAFHVPLFKQSSAGQSTSLIESFLAVSETQCDQYYEGYFTRLAIEKKEVEANPDNPTYGLCTKGWLAFINIVLVYHGIILIIMILMSADRFLEGVFGGDSSLLSNIHSKGQPAGVHSSTSAGSPPPPVVDQHTVINVPQDIEDPAPQAWYETKSESLPKLLATEQALPSKGDVPGMAAEQGRNAAWMA